MFIAFIGDIGGIAVSLAAVAFAAGGAAFSVGGGDSCLCSDLGSALGDAAGTGGAEERGEGDGLLAGIWWPSCCAKTAAGVKKHRQNAVNRSNCPKEYKNFFMILPLAESADVSLRTNPAKHPRPLTPG
jgi:hypothetical protein